MALPSLRGAFLLLALAGLTACSSENRGTVSARAYTPIPQETLSAMASIGSDRNAPVLIRAYKKESEIEVWKLAKTGQYALMKTYPVCRWSGQLGPKTREGDRQVPEGFYTITPGQMNPNSAYYLSFDLGYPNAFDRSLGRTGSNLMVHGDCSSRGCYSMTDEQIAEIYALGREAFFGGQKSFQVQAYPFRMTAENFAKHRSNPHIAFWKMLKQGNDHFEASRREVKVDVCEKRYVFDAQYPGDPSRPLSFSGASKCPVFEVPAEIAEAVQEKNRKDEVRIAELSRSTPVAPIRTNADGGMHPVFAAALKRSEPGAGVAAQPFSLASVPGTIPSHVNPPRTAEFADTPYASGPVALPTAAPAVATAPSSPRSGTVTRVANSEPGAIEQQAPATTSSSSSNMFGSLFGSKSSTASTAKSSDGPMDKMAKLIGLRSSEPTPAPAAAPKPPRPVATARAATSNNGAIRPKPVEASTRTAETPATPAAPAYAPAPAPAPVQAAAAPAGTMAGSAPTVPTGSFESRWSSFR